MRDARLKKEEERKKRKEKVWKRRWYERIHGWKMIWKRGMWRFRSDTPVVN